jgi:ATP-binding cassette subfamily F protein 2
MESIDALALAVNEYDGGLILVSHDMRLISQVAKEIWICDNKTITKYKGDIMNFKMDLQTQMGIDNAPKLKGDASVKATDKAKQEKPKPKPQPKLEVILPVVKSIPEEKPVVVAPPPAAPTPPPPKAAEPADDATAVTASTSTTSNSGDSSGAAAAPAKSRYVPPHLRKKMAQG